MIVCFHLATFLVNEYFTPEWQREVRDITRESSRPDVEKIKKDVRSEMEAEFRKKITALAAGSN